MIISWRGTALLLLTAPLLAMSAFIPQFGLVALIYAIFAVGLLIFDWWQARKPSFAIERHHEDKLSLGADNPITVSIKNKADRGIRFWLRDEPPDVWVDGATLLDGRILPRQTWSDTYHVHPLRRGDYQFGNITLRRLGPLGLTVHQSSVEKSAPVKVYPNLMDVARYDLLLRRNRLQEIGLRNVRQSGEGTEYERLREYLPDDDFRRIDWKATARRNKPITVEYQTERSQNIMAVIDIGRMMQTPVDKIMKLDYVINAVLLLSYVAGGMGDKMGLLTFTDRVETFIPPRQGRGQFLRLLEVLYKVNPQPIEPDYGRAISYLRRKQRRRSLVVIFTDALGGYSLNQLATNVNQLAKRSLPLVVTISDPDVVAASQQTPADSQSVFQQSAAANLLAERQLVLDRMAKRGVLTLDVPANELSIAVIQKYLDVKRTSAL